MTSETTPVTRGKFYTEDIQFVVFQAENVLHRVPRFALGQHSEMFRDMFQLPQPGADDEEGSRKEFSTSGGEGSSDENPIKVPNCFTNFEFESLLEFIYPTGKSKTLSQEQLLATLKLATHWEMHDVISNIEDYISRLKLTPAEMLTLEKEWKIQKLLEEGFFAFAARLTYEPSVKEAQTLGWDNIGQILLMREKLRIWSTAMEVTFNSLRCEGCVSKPRPFNRHRSSKESSGASPRCEVCESAFVSTAWVRSDNTLVQSVSPDEKKQLIELEISRTLETLLGSKYNP